MHLSGFYSLIILLLTILLAPLSLSAQTAANAPEAAPSRPALVPSIRLERITPLATTYHPAPPAALICPQLAGPLTMDGNLSDWPAPQGNETLSLGESEAPRVVLRAAWDEAALYLSAEITDTTIMLSAPEDIYSGDWLALALFSIGSECGALPEQEAHTYLISASAQGPLLLTAEGDKIPTEKTLAVADTPGRRIIELCLPWTSLRPLSPFGNDGMRLAIRLETRKSADEIEPNVIDTHGNEARLLMQRGEAKAIKAYLCLASEDLPAGESFEGTLFVIAPQPTAALPLRLQITTTKADGSARNLYQISTLLRLEQGLNSFRLHWDAGDQPAGEYGVKCSAISEATELFNVTSAFRITPKSSAWQQLDEDSKTLSVKSVLEKLQKAEPAAGIKFAVMGDLRGGERIFSELLSQAAREGAQFAVVTGDLVSSGLPNQYLNFAELLKNAPLPVLPTPGNHDYQNQGKGYYTRLFGQLNYSFDLAGYRFILLDNADGQLTASQLNWLEAKLQTPLPKFVFLHVPPANIKAWEWHAFTTGADRFVSLMEQYKPARVFVAHIHAYDRATLNGVEYILSGAAGAPFHSQLGPQSMIYHFILVEAAPAGVTDSVTKLGWEKEQKEAVPAKPATTTAPAAAPAAGG